MPKPKVAVIVASTREGRVGRKVADWVLEQAQKNEAIEAELVDLLDYDLPFYDDAKLPAMMGGQYPNAQVSKWSAKIGSMDGFILVTPEYNHGYPAPIKNAMDWLYTEWKDKPIAFVGYSGATTAAVRAVEQLRLVIVHLGIIGIAPALHFPSLHAVSQGAPFDGSHSEEAAEKVVAELVRWVNILKPVREQT
jgi:NAD(P)H-dependent FMN reductase